MGEPVYDVVVSKRYDKGCFKAAPVPPEEFGISARPKDIPTSPYCFHKFQRSASELIEEGYPKDVIDDLTTTNSRASDDNDEVAARDTFADESEDRKIVVTGKGVLVGVDMGGRGIIKKQKKKN